MKLGTVTQQPSERLSYTIDYKDFLTDGDNVSTATPSVSPSGLVIDEVSVLDPRVRFYVSSGTAGVKYKMQMDVTTADGRILQDEIIFKIKEVYWTWINLRFIAFFFYLVLFSTFYLVKTKARIAEGLFP